MNRFMRKNVKLFELTITLKHARKNLRNYKNRKLHKSTRKIIYALMKTVCNNTNILYGLKRIANKFCVHNYIKTRTKKFTHL
jgi:hypothetical protein